MSVTTSKESYTTERVELENFIKTNRETLAGTECCMRELERT